MTTEGGALPRMASQKMNALGWRLVIACGKGA